MNGVPTADLRIGLWRLIAACIVLILCASADAHPAAAHGYLVRSIPQDQSTVSRAPSQVQLWFSEPLEPKFSTIGVFDQNGQQVDLGGSVAVQDHERITAKLPASLPDGAYIVRFRLAFASDGHVVADRILFWVGKQTGTIGGAGAAQTADPFEVLARALSMIGALTAFGTLNMYLLVLRPAWRNPAYPAGGLAPRIMRALYRCAAAAIGLALIGQLIWLMQQSAALFGVGLGAVLSQGLWNIAMSGTTFGGVWVLRTLFLIGSGVSLGAAFWISRRRPGWVLPLWAIGAAAGGLALLSFSLGAHAAGSTLWTPFSVLIDWFHLLANGIWIGGLIGLVWALQAAFQTLNGDAQRLALLAALRRFSPLAAGALIMTIASGAYSALANVYTPDQLTDTAYGMTLSAKIVLIMPLVILGWLHNRAVKPIRFEAARGWIGRSLRIEAVLGGIVIILAGWLSATPPPVPPTARAAAVLPAYQTSSGSIGATLTLNPGTIGANAYDLQLTQNGQPLESPNVRLTFVFPGYSLRTDPLTLDAVGNGEYSGAGAELDRPGNWQALIDVTLPGSTAISSTATRLALTFSASAQTDQAAIRTPSLLNWLALLIVLGLLISGIFRWLRNRPAIRNFRRDPQFVLIGAGAAVLTIIVLIGGELFLSSASGNYAASANPTPLYINPALPDQASIDQGRQIFATTCATCHMAGDSASGNPTRPVPATPAGSPSAFSVSGYVAAHSDAGLYSFLLGSAVHPYGKDLAAPDRWALLNYLRAVIVPSGGGNASVIPTTSP